MRMFTCSDLFSFLFDDGNKFDCEYVLNIIEYIQRRVTRHPFSISPAGVF